MKNESNDERNDELEYCFVSQRAVHTLFTHLGLEHILSEEVPGVGHGEGGATSPGLGLNDLVSTELDAFREGLTLVVCHGGPSLAEEGQDGDPGMAADDSDVDLQGVRRGAKRRIREIYWIGLDAY